MGKPRKLPPDAFEYYFGLGIGRSYQAVAEHYGVQKSTVCARAKTEGWVERIAELERVAREQFEADARSELKAVRERQLKGTRALMAKGLEMLRDLPAEKAIKAAPALSVAWKHELLLLGEPTERAANVEEITKREVRELLIGKGEEDDWSDLAGEEESGAEPNQADQDDADDEVAPSL